MIVYYALCILAYILFWDRFSVSLDGVDWREKRSFGLFLIVGVLEFPFFFLVFGPI